MRSAPWTNDGIGLAVKVLPIASTARALKRIEAGQGQMGGQRLLENGQRHGTGQGHGEQTGHFLDGIVDAGGDPGLRFRHRFMTVVVSGETTTAIPSSIITIGGKKSVQ